MTSQEFAGMLNSNEQPWKRLWSDSSKEQYFSLLNAETANEMELESWRLNNEYNTPKAQMQRMIEAGINPAAAYQQISAGNSGSVPGTHKAEAARFHDTTDRLAKVNTVLSGIGQIMSTVGQGIGASQGIQDMALRHQNNWYDKMRADYFRGPGQSTVWLGDAEDVKHMDRPLEVAPGLFMDGTAAQLFPELYKGLSFQSGSYHIAQAARNDQHSLVERRNRIDQLVQDIFKELEGNASSEVLIRKFMELWSYILIQNHGGGF